VCISFAIAQSSYGQAFLEGTVYDEQGNPFELVQVSLKDRSRFVITNQQGYYRLECKPDTVVWVQFKFIGYRTQELSLTIGKNGRVKKDVRMLRDTLLLQEVGLEIQDKGAREQVSMIKIQPQSAKLLPSAFGDFNKILATLPGVSSNNELSSQYAVRGGNFDENLVYVNDMVIYRPNLIRAGQQEGLSFVNPDLVEDIEFSAGGWQPRFGDKLSSVLNIQYKRPTTFKASATAGLLGGAAHLEGRNGRFTYLIGVRHKRSQYLLNTLETQGEYLPQFTDYQGLFTYDFTGAAQRETGRFTRLELLTSYARNRYLVRPESRESTFGTINQTFRLFVGYLGQEEMQYDTWQTGLKLSHAFSKRFRTEWMTSWVRTSEREYFDVEGGYRLCDVNSNFGTPGFNECISTIGIGSIYTNARNKLEGVMLGLANRSYWDISKTHQVEAGFYMQEELLTDRYQEYSFLDSSDFVRILDRVRATNTLASTRSDFYLQHRWKLSERTTLSYGGRLGYWTLNRQWLFSPRIQIAHKPAWKRDIVLRAAVGYYRQPPFFREMRDRQGAINRDLQAQSSIHLIAGSDYLFKMWGRPFKFTSEAYYKYLWDVVPYDLDNIRIRYFAKNNAVAYATGADFRVSGEFIKGSESWFSLGVLQTRENIDGDSVGFLRRPSDQRLNVGIFFQDYIPGKPTLRVYLNLVYSTGLPFGPPDATQFRNFFQAPSYRRVDVGFSKLITFNDAGSPRSRYFESIWLGLEVLNLVGARNVISYQWIADFQNRQFAVPNTLSQRFFNLRIIARI
jgi:hypothetical protein